MKIIHPVYIVRYNEQCVAQCVSWHARAAALRLLYGTSLVIPPGVQVESIDPSTGRVIGTTCP